MEIAPSDPIAEMPKISELMCKKKSTQVGWLELDLLSWVKIEDVQIKRMLCIILNPNRYKSKASENFTKEILTLF